MAAPVVMSDEELFQLTGSWEAAAALRDEQNNSLNEYNWSQPAAPVAATVAAPAAEPAAVEETAPAVTYTSYETESGTVYEPVYTPAAVAEPVYTPAATPAAAETPAAGIASLIPNAVEEPAAPAPTYTQTDEQGTPIYDPPAVVAPVAPTGIAALAPAVTPSEGGVASLIKRPEPVEEPAEKPVDAPVAAPVAPSKETPATADVAPTDKLVQQILGQNLTKKWTGEGFGSAEKNAADMAKILASVGITDIKDFGKVTVPVDEEVRSDGSGGFVDSKGNPVDSSLVQSNIQAGESGDTVSYTAPVGKKEVFGNKKTGQAVENTYGERQTGNMFGGTYSGKGNTGYGVQFDEKGNPVFYTQGASSSDIGQIAPLLAAASFIPGLAPFAQGLNALIAAKSGNGLGAIASLAGMGGFSNVAQAANVANSIKNKNVLGLVGAGANLAGVGDLNVGGVGLNDITKGIGAIKALKSNNPLALAGVASSYLGGGSSDSPDSDDFEEGYFLPGGEGYVAPSITGTDEVDDTLDTTNATTSTAANTTTGSNATNILKSIGITNVDDLEDSGLTNDDLVNIVSGTPVTSTTSTTSTPAVTSTTTDDDTADDVIDTTTTGAGTVTSTNNTTTTGATDTVDTADDTDDTVDADDEDDEDTEDTTPAVTTKPVVKDDEVDKDTDDDSDDEKDVDEKDDSEEDADEKDDEEEDKDTDEEDDEEDDEEEEEEDEEEDKEEEEEDEEEEDGNPKKTKIGKGGSKKSAKSKPSKTKAVRTPTPKVPKTPKTSTKPVTTGTKVTTPVKTTPTTPVKTTTPVKPTVTTTPTTPIKPTITTTPTTTTTTTTPKTGGSKGVTGLPGGSKTTTAKPKTPTKNPAIDAITSLALKQERRNALLNAMGGKNELAKIKSYEELYGSGLFGDSYVPPSARGVEPDDVREPETQDFEEEFFNGGHVDDQSIDALLHMLRN